MNAHLRERILRKLEALTDERGYQVLDYVEFLESKFAERQTPTNAFARFSDAVEDRLRAGKLSASAIAETMGLLNRAANILNGAVAAGKSVATDIYSAAQSAASSRPSSGTSSAQSSPPGAASTGQPAQPQSKEASSPARDIPEPGSGEEHL